MNKILPIKFIRPGAFLLALACFTLPFLKISCNNRPVYSHAHGYQLAFGANRPVPENNKSKNADPKTEGDISDIPMQPIILGIFLTLSLGFITAILFTFLSKNYHIIITIALMVTAVSSCAYYFFSVSNNEYKDLKLVIPGIGLAITTGILLDYFTRLSASKIFPAIMSSLAFGLFLYFTIRYREILKLGDPGPQKIMGQTVTIVVEFLYGYWMAFGFTVSAFIFSFLPLYNKNILLLTAETGIPDKGQDNPE